MNWREWIGENELRNIKGHRSRKKCDVGTCETETKKKEKTLERRSKQIQLELNKEIKRDKKRLEELGLSCSFLQLI
jgi:hypothetical protein